MQINRAVHPFCGAEEINAKRNPDGTYCVTMAVMVREEDDFCKDRQHEMVVQMPRANIAIEALAAKDDKQTLYAITIPGDEDDCELPSYTTTVDDWQKLGFRESEARRLADENCSG